MLSQPPQPRSDRTLNPSEIIRVSALFPSIVSLGPCMAVDVSFTPPRPRAPIVIQLPMGSHC